MRFEDAYLKYIEFATDRQKKQSVYTLKQRFKDCILPFWKDYDIYNIKDTDYLKWQHSCLQQNYSNLYLRGLHYVMCAFFDYCTLFLNLDYNIAKKIGNFRMTNVKVEHDFYTLKEFKKFIKGFDNEIYKKFFIFMFFTGCRPGEAMALKFSDLSYCSISINKTISEHPIEGERIIYDPKSMSSFRNIYIDKKLYCELSDLKKEYIDEYNDSNFDYYVFGGKKPLAPTTINRYKKKACMRVGIRPIKLHEFRHSHASLLNNSNISIHDIKERLGHSSVDITSSVYVHTYKNKKRITRILNLFRLFF